MLFACIGKSEEISQGSDMISVNSFLHVPQNSSEDDCR